MEIKYADFGRMHEPLKSSFEKAFQDVYNSQWFIRGKQLEEFEKAFAEYCGSSYCVGVGNGLDALRLLLKAYDIGKGDEVIVPSNTFIATVLAITDVGAIPVFVEPDLDTLLIDPTGVEEKITDKTRAIMVVHLYGRLADMEAIQEIADRHGLFVFEDAAQAHGVSRNGKKAGNFANGAAFSFYPGKNLGAFGDAGAVVVNEEKIYKKIQALGNYGSHKKYQHDYLGVNSRLDEFQAAFLKIKLACLDQWNQERQKIARRYYEEIQNEKIRLPKQTEENVYHIFPVFCEERDALAAYLEKRGIHTLIHYPIPIHLQKAYAFLNYHPGDFPAAEKISATELSIPLYPGLTAEEISYIIDGINAF